MKNKPRTKKKLNGFDRAWICKYCGAPYCDPMFLRSDTPAGKKIRYRLRNKLCIGCGHNPCTCKNTGRK